MSKCDNSWLVQVYFNDLDAFGMVNHAYYALLLDRAWWPFWAERGYGAHSPDAQQVIREMTLSYYAPITELGEVSVELWGNRVGMTSADFRFAIRSAGETVLHAEGRRVSVRLDAKTYRATAWSDEARRDMTALIRPSGSDVVDATPTAR